MITAGAGSTGSSTAIAARTSGNAGSSASSGSTVGPPARASARAARRWYTGSGRPSIRISRTSEVPGERGPVRLALLQEGVAALDRLVRHVGQPGRLTGEQLLADQPVVNQVERVLDHPLRGR